MLTLLLFLAPAHGADWPDDLPWLDAERGGGALVDPLDDAPPALDLTHDGGAVLAWTADAASVWFRLAVAAPPAPDGALTADGWGVLWDVDADGEPEALLAVVDGAVGTWWTDGDVWLADAELPGAGARVVEQPDGSARVELQAPVEALRARLGWDPALPVAWAPVTFAGVDPGVWADQACAAPCALVDAAADPVTVDADGDGLALPWELRLGTDPHDADHDDDGVPDGDDPDPLSCDADGDGLLDPVELGVTEPLEDTAPGGCFRPDADPATTTDPTRADTDGGGLPDGVEDRDGDGRVSGPWETDPADPADDADQDGDGLADVLERVDGVAPDTDGDGVPDDLDPDSDDDGIPDGVDGVLDPDGDGLPAFRDRDADGDGIPDGRDGLEDPDGDGLGAWLDVDADGDGIPDSVEGTSDHDGDGVPNHLDADSDGDGIPDAVEGTADADCDGRPDYLDVVRDDGFCDTDLPTGPVDDGPFDAPFHPVEPVTVDDFGRGCQVGGLPSGVALWALPLLLGRRRRRG